jgi:hypothetical protein
MSHSNCYPETFSSRFPARTCVVRIDRREFKAIPCKPELIIAFRWRRHTWFSSWHGYRHASLMFLSLTRRNTAPLTMEGLAPYKSLPTVMHADQSP